jgi:agmatine deiminase
MKTLAPWRRTTIYLCGLLAAACARQEPSPPASARRLAGEFEAQNAIVIGMAQLVQFHSAALVEIVRALQGHVRILGMVGSRSEEQLVARLLFDNGIDPSSLEFLLIPVDTMWARDFGPLFVLDADSVRVVDTDYPGTELNRRENFVPQTLARWLKAVHSPLPLLLEGGNLLGNGEAIVVTTTEALRRNLAARQITQAHTQALLAATFGAERIAYLRPLERDPTAHIDMFCVFTAVDQVVVARIDASLDAENAARLDEAANALLGLPTSLGPLRVERVEMPAAADGVWRSYTNIILANSAVLVPIYPTAAPELDAQALALYARLFPQRKVVGIRAETLAARGGALHCISFNVPAFVPMPPIGPSRS